MPSGRPADDVSTTSSVSPSLSSWMLCRSLPETANHNTPQQTISNYSYYAWDGVRICRWTWGKVFDWLLCTYTHTHFTTLCLGLPRLAGTRKVKPIRILLKQETVSGSVISWAICKSAPRSRQTTTPAPHNSVFYRPDVFPAAQPIASKHWR